MKLNVKILSNLFLLCLQNYIPKSIVIKYNCCSSEVYLILSI